MRLGVKFFYWKFVVKIYVFGGICLVYVLKKKISSGLWRFNMVELRVVSTVLFFKIFINKMEENEYD